MIKFLRCLLYLFVIKPLVYLCIGINVSNVQNIPKNGPCILLCNHNSHLDTLVLISLFSLDTMLKIPPVAAADYFLKNKIVAWFAFNIFNIIPICRNVSKNSNSAFNDILDKRIKDGSIIILYPEGTRGLPEKLADFKSGIFHIAKKYPDIPIIPCYIKGLGLVLPKDEILAVPAICRINVGEKIKFNPDKEEFMCTLKDRYVAMTEEK